jgi:AraC-like DNA-binding protein
VAFAYIIFIVMLYKPPFIRDEYNRIDLTLRGAQGKLSTINFRFLESGIMFTEDPWIVETPKPTFNRIFLVTKHACKVEMNHTTTTLSAGEIFLFPIHRSFVVTYQPECEFIYFHFGIIDETGLDLMRFIDHVYRFPYPQNVVFNNIVENYYTDTAISVVKWQSVLFNLIVQLINNSVIEQHLSGSLSVRHQEIVSYIQNNLSTVITVNDLALRFGISRSALSKGFHREMGISLKEYIDSLILHKALQLLSETDLSVKEIATYLGYQDPFYFHRVFKKKMFETPMQYRKASLYERSFKTKNAEHISSNRLEKTTDKR